MIKAFSERLMPPYSGQVQIAQSDTYRALTLDGEIWEIQYVNRSHVRVATLTASEIKSQAVRTELLDGRDSVDQQLIELLDYLATIELPFPATDHYEYWLLDAAEQRPLALIFSCSEQAQMDKFPARAEWTALPAAVMPIVKTPQEEESQTPPVNYRVERQVAERAGTAGKAKWYNRRERNDEFFPPFMLREDWPESEQTELCRRYIERQAPRLLMLHALDEQQRRRLEACCRPHAMEVARFSGVYPRIFDELMVKALRVEAKLRASAEGGSQSNVSNRRDGILYI